MSGLRLNKKNMDGVNALAMSSAGSLSETGQLASCGLPERETHEPRVVLTGCVVFGWEIQRGAFPMQPRFKG